jgi:hypothetical protein
MRNLLHITRLHIDDIGIYITRLHPANQREKLTVGRPFAVHIILSSARAELHIEPELLRTIGIGIAGRCR